ncbi:DUF2845 domain-containing protein [Marinobacter sp. OP 3.4]|uniref:DUF2845 domain-containing protein n=1 Tax=Marinobacter sp. OP 3.4 TaxID=3076501 RepID=UPI002E1D6176
MECHGCWWHGGVMAGLLMLALPLFASASVRCGASLVDIGDWPVEVEESCGEPDYIATYPSATIPGVGVVEEMEHWYYNRGPRHFVRRFEFRNGKLQREDTLGYGFAGDSPGPCTPAAIDEGTSEFEVVARCGEPLSSRVEWSTLSGSYRQAGTVQGLVPIQEWLYEFGRNQFRRVVVLKNGRVVRLEKADKPR